MAQAAEAAPTLEAREEDFAAAFEDAVKAAVSGEQPAGGEDTAPAASGADTQSAAGGEDTVKAADGKDTVEAAAGADTQPAAVGEDTVKGADGKDATETPPAEKQADATAAAALDTNKPSEVPKAETPPAEPPKAPEKTAEQIAAEKKQAEELEAALADYAPTEEETKAYEAAKRDFPEITAALELQRKQLDRIITQRVYNAAQAVLEHVARTVTPAVEGYQQTAQERHFSTIKAAHADYEALRPEVETWIKAQPAYLRAPLEQTFKQGAAGDVIDLYTRFKKEAGKVTDKPAAAPAAPAAPAKPSGPSKEDVAALAPVSSKRSVPGTKGSADLNDFDGAWEEALKVAGAR